MQGNAEMCHKLPDLQALGTADQAIVRYAIRMLKEERSEPDAADDDCLVEICRYWLLESR
tara:strand:+ start:537 stop:716 length:180 start_codon:yes stop_codon:yes gene_type:complete